MHQLADSHPLVLLTEAISQEKAKYKLTVPHEDVQSVLISTIVSMLGQSGGSGVRRIETGSCLHALAAAFANSRANSLLHEAMDECVTSKLLRDYHLPDGLCVFIYAWSNVISHTS